MQGQANGSRTPTNGGSERDELSRDSRGGDGLSPAPQRVHPGLRVSGRDVLQSSSPLRVENQFLKHVWYDISVTWTS